MFALETADPFSCPNVSLLLVQGLVEEKVKKKSVKRLRGPIALLKDLGTALGNVPRHHKSADGSQQVASNKSSIA